MIRFLAAVLFGLVVMSSAGAQALRKPVEYPGVTYPQPAPGAGRTTYIQPGQAANGARFSGGAIVDVGRIKPSALIPEQALPAQMRLRGGASRTFGRALARLSPWLAGGLVAGWLYQEGVKICNEGGTQFWCKDLNRKYNGWHFYTPAMDLGWFPTPDAAAAAMFKKVHTSPSWTYSYPPCVATVPGVNTTFTCSYTVTPVPGNNSPGYSGSTQVSGREMVEPDLGTRPAVEADFDQVADKHPIAAPDVLPGTTLDPNADALVNASPEPLPVTDPEFKPGFYPASEYPQPYPCAAFASRSCLDGFRVSPAPGPDCPNCANVLPVTVDASSSEAKAAPQPGTSTAPSAGQDAGTTVDKDKDPCELNPTRLGCMQLGEDEGKQVPKKSKDLSFAAESIGLPAGCPADEPGPGGKPGISYASACQAATGARPVVVALGAMAALLIVLAAVRS